MKNGNRKNNHSPSSLSSPLITKWLHENYTMGVGTSMPRSLLYTHYLDFCTKNGIEPVNSACFGKLIRYNFPDIKTRRLGTRGQSKYHYDGLSVKATSIYSNNVKDIKWNGCDEAAIEEKVSKKIRKGSAKPNSIGLSPKGGTSLPPFPSVDILQGDASTKEKTKTFLIMYRAHCQRILETIFTANFREVQILLNHFWQGLPSHIAKLLSNQSVVDFISGCDHILYKSIANILIPETMQPVPVSLLEAIQHFAKELPVWLKNALYFLPKELQTMKIIVAKNFSKLLCRLASLSQLAPAARTVLHNKEPLSQLLLDVQAINFNEILKQAAWLSPASSTDKVLKLAKKFFKDFVELLKNQATIDAYINWVSSLLSACILKPSEVNDWSFEELSKDFLLKWSFITTKMIEDLTLKSALSFCSFHIIQMFFDGYIFHMIQKHADEHKEIEHNEADTTSPSQPTITPTLNQVYSIIDEYPRYPSGSAYSMENNPSYVSREFDFSHVNIDNKLQYSTNNHDSFLYHAEKAPRNNNSNQEVTIWPSFTPIYDENQYKRNSFNSKDDAIMQQLEKRTRYLMEASNCTNNFDNIYRLSEENDIKYVNQTHVPIVNNYGYGWY